VRPVSRFLARHWLTLTAVVGVGVLAIAQAIWFRATKPTLPHLALVTVGGLVAWGAFLLLLICIAWQVRRPLRDLRYRWVTRDIDRQMKATLPSPPGRFYYKMRS
jgi:hypothetical protein